MSVHRPLATFAALACAGGVLAAAPATASPASVPSFQNCAAMHVHYRGGVSLPGARDHRASGHARFKPVVSAALYHANRHLDRDGDGIACEH